MVLFRLDMLLQTTDGTVVPVRYQGTLRPR